MNPVHFSSASDDWATPRDLAAKIFAEYPCTTDVCATAENTLCPHYFPPEADGLLQGWYGVCWMNPPYGRQIGRWVEKAALSAARGAATVVCLLPARTDTKWWHRWCEPVLRGVEPGEVVFLEGRLKFGNAKAGAPFPSVVVVFKKRE